MQQYLPFTVLKLPNCDYYGENARVATVLTVYGIETIGNELLYIGGKAMVATVLTVYGIETEIESMSFDIRLRLQQYLPFTVLKRIQIIINITMILVATVLTVYGIETCLIRTSRSFVVLVATVLTVYGIET